jgi:ABC-type polysaccharide/polyol phosphate transport system ATPase subunit
MGPLEPGEIRVRSVSRRFKIVHERSATLKETLIRRQRARTTDLWALRDVSLDVGPGEAVAIVGQNGSGKSTLLKLLAGIIPPDTGRVDMGGTVASMLELGAGFHPDFTGRENVFMNGAIHGLTERQIHSRLDEIVEFAEIPDFIDMPVRTYSSGMQLRLAFAVAAHVNPDILLLDEVLAVGDESFQRKCLGRIQAFLDGGGTLVFVSHDAGSVERVCSRAVLVSGGQVIMDDKPPEVIAAYHRLLSESAAPPGAQLHSHTRDDNAVATPEPEPPSPLGGWGTGQAFIEAVEVVGPAGPTTSFVSGDTLEVRVAIRARTPIPQPNVGIGIASAHDRTVLYGTNTRIAEVHVPELSGAMHATFRVPSLHLQDGDFVVNLAVVSYDEATVFHWLDNAAVFNVFHRRPGVGLVALDGDWIIPSDTAAGDRAQQAR